MTTALTTTTWIATLRKIKLLTTDDTTRTLAQMLLDIIDAVDTPAIDAILDAYGARLLGP